MPCKHGHGNLKEHCPECIREADAEMIAFEDECFRCWLNRIDARIGYDLRRSYPVVMWREQFDNGVSETDAIFYFAGAE